MATSIDASSLVTATAQAGGARRSADSEAAPRQVVASGGNAAPVSNAPLASSAPSAQDVAQAARDISEYIQTVNRALQIEVDKTLGSTIITVFDSDTDEVVRQIPQEEIVEVARFLEQQLAAENASQANPVRGLLVDNEG